ncbi:MAG TPA: hypothetical protein VGL57_05675 [Solirubrobacteraceae bacterium]
MSTTPPSPASHYQSSAEHSSAGWAVFVAVYLVIAGVLNIVWGIVALDNKSYFVSGGLLWSELNTWGWVAIIVGAVQILGSMLVVVRRAGGAVIAGFLAFFGIMLNFLSIGAYPVWSVILLVVDALIIWAVTVHSDAFVGD